MDRLIFFIDTSTHLSGAQKILLDLAAYIADNSNYDVYYVNNYFSDDASKHSESKLKYETLESFDFSKSENTIYFTPVNYTLHLLSKIKNFPEAKICHYIYDAQAVRWLVSHIGKWNCEKIINELIAQSNSCAYLNYRCVIPQDKFNRYEDKVFIPYSLERPFTKFDCVQELVDKESINIAYYGNMNTFSSSVLQNLFYNMALMKNDRPVNVHIIGHVLSFPRLDFKIASTDIVRLIFTGHLSFEDSVNYIRNNVDLVISYGENVIESALFGVPVVVPVVEDKPYKGNNYVFFFDVSGFLYSWTNESLLSLNNTCYKIDKVLQALYIGDQKFELAKKCQEYCYNNNSLESASSKFYKLIENTTLKVKDYTAIKEVSDVLSNYDIYLEKNIAGNFSDFLCKKSK